MAAVAVRAAAVALAFPVAAGSGFRAAVSDSPEAADRAEDIPAAMMVEAGND